MVVRKPEVKRPLRVEGTVCEGVNRVCWFEHVIVHRTKKADSFMVK